MRELLVSYTELLEIAAAHNETIYASRGGGPSGWWLTLVFGETIIEACPEAANKETFEASVLPGCTEVLTRDGAIARDLLASGEIARAVIDDKGRVVRSNIPHTPGLHTWICVRGDSAQERGGGERLSCAWTAEEARGTKETGRGRVAGEGQPEDPPAVRFCEPLEVHDGHVMLSGSWTADDELWVETLLPATELAAGNGTGNANLTEAGHIVPAAGNGTYVVNLAQAVPVPPPRGEDGAWLVDFWTGAVSAPPAGRVGNFNLLPVPMTTRMGSSTCDEMIMDVDTASVEWLHPRWQPKLRVLKTSSGAGRVTLRLTCYREKIVPDRSLVP